MAKKAAAKTATPAKKVAAKKVAKPAIQQAAPAPTATLDDIVAQHYDILFNRLNTGYGPIPDRYYPKGHNKPADLKAMVQDLAARHHPNEKAIQAFITNTINEVLHEAATEQQ